MPSLGRIAKLENVLMQGRSKGIVIVEGIQDPEVMKDDKYYGPRLGRSVMSLCEHQAILRLPDEEAAKHGSGVFGKVELIEVETGNSEGYSAGGPQHGTSERRVEKEKAVVHFSDLQYLPKTGWDEETNTMNGLTCFTKSFNRARKQHLHPNELFGEEGKSNGELKPQLVLTDEPEVEEWPKDEFESTPAQELEEWTLDDLVRLNLYIPEMVATLGPVERHEYEKACELHRKHRESAAAYEDERIQELAEKGVLDHLAPDEDVAAMPIDRLRDLMQQFRNSREVKVKNRRVFVDGQPVRPEEIN
jgi:hypothetical protein